MGHYDKFYEKLADEARQATRPPKRCANCDAVIPCRCAEYCCLKCKWEFEGIYENND